MSRRGENIHKRKDGRWEGRIPVFNNDNKIVKYQSVYAHSYRDVKSLMKQNKFEIQNVNTDKKIITMEQLCEQWLDKIQLFVKQSTYAKYEQIIYRHILPLLSYTDVSKINDEAVSDFIRDKMKNGRLDGKGGLSPKTIQDIFTVLKQILNYACNKQYIPPLSFDIEKPKAVQKPFSVLTAKQQAKFVLYLRNHLSLETLGILISLYTGIRVGELCALKWSDLDLQSSVLHINKTLQRIKNTDKNAKTKTKIIIDIPKSHKSIRDIPIPSFLWSILNMYSKDYSKDSYFLTGKENQFTEPRLFQYKFKIHLSNAGLPDMNIHALRHTFATRAVEEKFDIKTLSEILGHSTVRFTLERYVYSSYELKAQSMEKMKVCF